MTNIATIIDTIQSIAGKEYTTYSPLDRQIVIQQHILLLKELDKYRKIATDKNRERKLYKAKQMKLLVGTVKDRESEIEESQEYQQLTIDGDIAEINKDYARDTLPVFNSLITLIRDAEKLVGEEIR